MESGHLKENDLFLTHPPGNMKRKKARQKGTPDTQEGEITTSELLKKSVRGKFMENKTKNKRWSRTRTKQT